MQRSLYANSRVLRGCQIVLSRSLRLTWQEFDPPSRTGSPLSPFVISHGMLGNKRNWTTAGRILAEKTSRKVYAVDLRNHGQSPHSDEMTFFSMAEDVVEFCRHHDIASSILIGHSMGGRVAMTVALTRPEIVDRLVIVDASPSPKLGTRWNWVMNVLRAMNQLDLSKVKNQMDADAKLRSLIEDKGLRQFVLTNLRKNARHEYEWAANVPVMLASEKHLFTFPTFTTQFTKDTLFVGALKPNTLEPELDYIMNLFPTAKVRYLNTSHFVHHEDPKGFVELVDAFVDPNRTQDIPHLY